MVLLHAGVADSRMWEAQARALDPRFRVLAPDLRGFGDRPHEPGQFSHAEDVLALLDAEGLEHAAVVGASFGWSPSARRRTGCWRPASRPQPSS